mmetsp:Transcript_74963/g.188719  ORF Transcript_74963/g.188719 Transcript_74963/m.188719 type:complete len:200 (+) Transcript_74963:853-1452(+)
MARSRPRPNGRHASKTPWIRSCRRPPMRRSPARATTSARVRPPSRRGRIWTGCSPGCARGSPRASTLPLGDPQSARQQASTARRTPRVCSPARARTRSSTGCATRTDRSGSPCAKRSSQWVSIARPGQPPLRGRSSSLEATARTKRWVSSSRTSTYLGWQVGSRASKCSSGILRGRVMGSSGSCFSPQPQPGLSFSTSS